MYGLSVFLLLLVNNLLVDALNIRREAATITEVVTVTSSVSASATLADPAQVLISDIEILNDTLNDLPEDAINFFADYASRVHALESVFSEYLSAVSAGNPPPSLPTIAVPTVTKETVVTTIPPTPLPTGQFSILPINATDNFTVVFPLPTIVEPTPTITISTVNPIPTNGTVNTTLTIPTVNTTLTIPTVNTTLIPAANTTLPLPLFPIPTANGTANHTLSIHMPIPVSVIPTWNSSTPLITSTSTGILIANGSTTTFIRTEVFTSTITTTPVLVTNNSTSTFVNPSLNASTIDIPPFANASATEVAATGNSSVFTLPLVTPASTTSIAGNGSIVTLVSTKTLGDVYITANLSTLVIPVATSLVTATSSALNGSALTFVNTRNYTESNVLITANVSTIVTSTPVTTVETITSTALNGSVATYTSTYTAREVLVTGNVSTFALATGGTFTTTQILTSTVWVPPPTVTASRIGSVVPTSYLGFDARARSNIAAYYQPRNSQSTEELDALCEDPSVNIINIPLVSRFQGPQAYPQIEPFPGCGAANAEQQKTAPGLRDCPDLATSVKNCQALGKKILVSVGNNTTGEKAKTFSSAEEARDFASKLWKLFGGGDIEPSALKPFGSAGDVTVDGFGIEDNLDSPYYDVLASTLRDYFNQDFSKTYYVSSAQGCKIPSPNASGVLRNMDFIYIRTQDASAGCASDLTSLINEWNTALLPQPPQGDATPEVMGTRILIGGKAAAKEGTVEALGARSVYDNSGFVRNVAKLYDSGHFSNLGGVAFWPGEKDLSSGTWSEFLKEVKVAVSPKDVQ